VTLDNLRLPLKDHRVGVGIHEQTVARQGSLVFCVSKSSETERERMEPLEAQKACLRGMPDTDTNHDRKLGQTLRSIRLTGIAKNRQCGIRMRGFLLNFFAAARIVSLIMKLTISKDECIGFSSYTHLRLYSSHIKNGGGHETEGLYHQKNS
jgi:hypothetical protein